MVLQRDTHQEQDGHPLLAIDQVPFRRAGEHPDVVRLRDVLAGKPLILQIVQQPQDGIFTPLEQPLVQRNLENAIADRRRRQPEIIFRHS